jgi:predicted nuclease of predicted toxin-antitoxin system
VKFKLDENLPVSAGTVLASGGHDVDTVRAEGLTGAPDQDIVVAATAEGRILISLDRGLGDIRSYPPGSHAGIIVLRLADQSAVTVTKAITDLAGLAELGSLAGAVSAAAARAAADPPPLTLGPPCAACAGRCSGADVSWQPRR